MKLHLIIALLFSSSLLLAQESPLTLASIWASGELSYNQVPGFNFQKDGRHYTRLEDGTIRQYDLESGNATKDLLDIAQLRVTHPDFEVSGYEFSTDESKILIFNEMTSIYRYSFLAKYYIYDAKAKTLRAVDDDKVQSVHFSPNGLRIAYVKNNNLYVQDLSDGIAKQITSDGHYNNIINGLTDWVYEEEFAFVRAFEWAPDNNHLAYLKFDESKVKEFTMTNYYDQLYPSYYTFKYPKVGEANSIVTAHIYNTRKESTTDLELNENPDSYLPRLQWTPDNKLCLTWLNRHQNHLKLYTVDPDIGKTTLLFSEKNPYYIDLQDRIYFLKDKQGFLWESETDGYNHIYAYDIKGNLVKQLTKGNYDVTEMYGYAPGKNLVYFQSAEKSPMERSVRSVDVNSGKIKNLHIADGSSSAQFSTNFDYAVIKHSDINTAPTYTVYNQRNKVVRQIETNAGYKAIMANYGAALLDFFSFKTEEGTSLNGWMLKPTNFNAEKKYPVLLYVYGGPGSQLVNDKFSGGNYWWFQYLAQQGYIIACVDNRGTGGRGQEFKKMTYQQLGKYETMDQIAAGKYMASLPYTNANRIGIFGWSYGGYMSSLCILKGGDVFKAAIAVAPVTSWKWYDSVYTERYMRTLAENENGYVDNSPIYFADQLKGNYLLVHGMGDDNVHFQHTAEMANALIAANKQFDTYFYPNRNHGIYGGYTRLHLFTKMTDFLKENL